MHYMYIKYVYQCTIFKTFTMLLAMLVTIMKVERLQHFNTGD